MKITKKDLSDYACFDLGVPLDSFVDNINVALSSYLVNENYTYRTVNTHTAHIMYTENDKVCRGTQDLIYYNADTSKGNSGGPVYITESAYGKTYYTVVAIHTHSDINEPAEENFGTRITTDLINFYKSNDYLLEEGWY